MRLWDSSIFRAASGSEQVVEGDLFGTVLFGVGQMMATFVRRRVVSAT